MRLSVGAVRPCTVTSKPHVPIRYCYTIAAPPPPKLNNNLSMDSSSTTTQPLHNWERLLLHSDTQTTPPWFTDTTPVRLNKRWMEYQGVSNWEGLLDPLDDNLRKEIIRYGNFVEAAYRAFDFHPSSPSYASCRHPRSSLMERCGFPDTGYRLTKNLRATSGIQMPRWTARVPSWVSTQSSWIGYVAVCQDKEEIARLGRRDVVIAFRGTATCLEWLENLRANLTDLPNSSDRDRDRDRDHHVRVDSCRPMVESGFLSLYTSGTSTCPSLQCLVREEVSRVLSSYPDEPLSLTITGHSLGAALAKLTAYDIKTTFRNAPMVTVMSFGGPRVGNRSFGCLLEKQGTKILRIVNSDDLITKVPGFVIGHQMKNNRQVHVSNLPGWIQKGVEHTQWVYADVGRELRLSSRDSPHLSAINVATCHDLKTYLHLVDGFVSTTCPFRATARRMMNKTNTNTNTNTKTVA